MKENFINNCLKHFAYHRINLSLKHKFPSNIYKYVHIIQQLTHHTPSLKLLIYVPKVYVLVNFGVLTQGHVPMPLRTSMHGFFQGYFQVFHLRVLYHSFALDFPKDRSPLLLFFSNHPSWCLKIGFFFLFLSAFNSLHTAHHTYSSQFKQNKAYFIVVKYIIIIRNKFQSFHSNVMYNQDSYVQT